MYEDVIRPNFSHLIEKENFNFTDFLRSIIAPTKGLLDDYKEDPERYDQFLESIYLYSLDENQKHEHISETPTELMEKAGYKLYRCKTIQSVERFRKYYAEDELICTFKDIERRLEECEIFFAVKKNVKSIRREDFINPERQDEYGTSVISIQFSKTNGMVSIKNRYNHAVLFPDATFSNNLDNIIEGLTDSFITHYELGRVKKPYFRKFFMPRYYQPTCDKYDGCYGPQYKIVNHIGRYVYSDNNVVIDTKECDKIIKYDTAQYVLANYYLIDLKNHTIKLIDQSIEDEFVQHFENIERIEVLSGENNERIIYVYQKDKHVVKIKIDKCNRIIAIKNPNIKKIGNNYMQYCENVQEIEFESLIEVGDNFIPKSLNVEKVGLDRVVKVGDGFLRATPKLIKLSLPNLVKAGENFLQICANMQSLYVPMLEEVGDGSLNFNSKMEDASFESLRVAPAQFLQRFKNLKILSAPKLQNINDLHPQIQNLLVGSHQI